MKNTYLKESFTSDFDNDKLFTSKFDAEDNMILYTYMDKKAANDLFKYIVGSRFNTTSNYKQLNPIQLPITLYETPEIAKLMSTKSNQQLVAFSINMNTKTYDEFNVALLMRLKANNIKVEDYKHKSTLWREKKVYNKYNYISYTIRDKEIIVVAQLQDS